jgi:hypothetical protein
MECFDAVALELPPFVRSLAAASMLRDKVERKGVAFMFGDIPAAETRKELLLEVLEPSYLGGAAAHIIHRCRERKVLHWFEAQRLADVFPKAYGDRYLKKAQLTLMFIAGQWMATGGDAIQLEDISAAADYQLPKVLRSLGLLQYSEVLATAIDQGQEIVSDSTEERAIRAATIFACDTLTEQFGCTIAQVDFWLWLMRNSAKTAEFHRTFTTDY